MSADPRIPPDIAFVVRVRDGNIVETWMRDGMTGIELAAILRRIADGFENGEATRIDERQFE